VRPESRHSITAANVITGITVRTPNKPSDRNHKSSFNSLRFSALFIGWCNMNKAADTAIAMANIINTGADSVMKNKIKIWDIATPLTYEHYCGTYHGSFMTKMLPGKKQRMYPSKSKDLENVYFAGQRLMPPGGMPCAVVTGRRAAQYLCKDSDMEFIS